MIEQEYDLQDYTQLLQAEEHLEFETLLQEVAQEAILEDQSRHPLAQFSQPYDWSSVLRYTS
jgi:hypothetical protein